MTENQERFIQWVRKNQPTLYRKTIQRVGVGLGAADQKSWFQTFIDGAKEIVPMVVKAKSQQRVLRAQMKRAEQGLPPLNVDQLAPTVKIQAGMTDDMKKILIPSIAVGAAILLFAVMRKK